MHEAAARILDDIEAALALPDHDEIVRQALRATFLVEHGHVSEEEVHEVIWRAVEASGYLATHKERDIERILSWTASKVAEAVIAGTDADELSEIIELEWAIDAYLDEEGQPRETTERSDAPPDFTGRLTSVDQVDDSGKIEWWVRPLVPKGHLVLLAGEGGIGKGLLSISFTVEIVRAGGRVLWLSVEDDAGTIKSRLHAAGCDDECMKNVIYGERMAPDELVAAIEWAEADVVILDAGRDYMRRRNGQGSNNDDDTIRPGLIELRQIAMHTGTSIVFIHHSPKSHHRQDGSVKDGAERVLGGTSFKDVPRFVMLLARNGDREVAVGLVKANKTRRDVGFKVEMHDFAPDGMSLDDILDDEDREVYVVRDLEAFDDYDLWLTKKSASAGPVVRDDEVMELIRGVGKRELPAARKLFELNPDSGLRRSEIEASYTRLAAAGTIIYNDKRKSWYLTED